MNRRSHRLLLLVSEHRLQILQQVLGAYSFVGEHHLVLSQSTHVTDRRTDRQNYDSQDRPRICSRGKNGGLDQYGFEPFEQQQLGTAGVEGVNELLSFWGFVG